MRGLSILLAVFLIIYSASPASNVALSVPNFKRGWAKGARTNFYEARVPDYTSARARGAAQVADYLVAVNNAYCKEYTWWLEPPAEPTPADLAKTDDELEPAELALKAAKMSRLRKVRVRPVSGASRRVDKCVSGFSQHSRASQQPRARHIQNVARPDQA